MNLKVGDTVKLISTNITENCYGWDEDLLRVGETGIITEYDPDYKHVIVGDYAYSIKDVELIPVLSPKKASDRQEAGNHYSKLKIQPMQYCLKNNLNYGQSNAIKYVTRYKDKNGIEDLRKAIHCIELLIEFEESLDKE